MKIKSLKCMLMAQDMDRAVAFWRDVVGLEVGLHTSHWSELAWRDAIVALHGGGTGEGHASGLGLQVEDLDAACQEVAAGGGRVLSGPEDRPGEGIRLANLVDTEGNAFVLSQVVG